MSHSVVWVLLPGSTKPKEIEGKITEALAPFDEGTRVPAYRETCYCVGSEAKSAASEAAGRKVGTIEALRARFQEDPRVKRENALQFQRGRTADEDAELAKLSEETQTAWEDMLKPYDAAEREAFEAHPKHKAADPECSECNGSGQRETTYNPKSKWDWWVIGGRWDGDIFDPPKPGKNARKVGDMPSPVPDNLIPFSILTPDGEWHQKGQMGWWGMVADKKKGWPDIAREILAKHQDTLAVAVDVHI